MAPRQGGAAKDSFWGNAGAATQKGKAVATGGASQNVAQGGEVAAKTEAQEATPKAAEPPNGLGAAGGAEKVEGGLENEVFEDDDDDLLPEAQPSFPRNEVAKDAVKFRQNAVHVYGLDFLKTGHMDEIFSQFNHKFVEWINDSSANIIFADAASAKKALESLSFPKTGDDPWRRTPDILVSEDVPPIFLQMRLAASTDVKPSKRGVPEAHPRVHYSAGPRRDNYPDSTRKRMYSDGPAAEGQSLNAAKRPRKAGISEEELQKRKKRAQRFGEVQPASGIAEKKPEEATECTTSPPAAATTATETSKPGEPETGDEGPAEGKSDAAAEAAPDQK